MKHRLHTYGHHVLALHAAPCTVSQPSFTFGARIPLACNAWGHVPHGWL